MEKFFKHISESAKTIENILHTIRKMDSEMTHITMSPIDRHILLSYALSNEALFHYSYDDWRLKRINKILEIYDIEDLKEKKILELGCGHGEIGACLADIGANVLALDGRKKNVNFAKLKHREIKNFKCIKFNLEQDFSKFGKFDLIINFGLFYHLKNAEQHLKCCFEIADDILFETVVCDSIDPQKIFFCDENENIDEEALEGTGCRPSPFYIERIAKENNFEVIRYFDSNLNSGNKFIYDWEHKNDERLGDDWKLRRFWRFLKMQ